jgi:high-affinity iron transporter
MLANFLIGLREGLEAALVIGILIAYVVKTGRRDLLPAVWAGIGTAVVISLAFGALLTFGPRHLTSEAQDAIGGTLSIAAVGLVTWMIFWMARTARFLKSNLQHGLDTAIAAGKMAVVVMALLAVGREGLETALFLWTGATSTGTSTSPLLGAALGLAVAIALGWLVYRGAVRLNLRVFFAWTGLFLVVVAAGVLAYGVHDLQEAGFLPGADVFAFDVSAVISPTTWYATLLKGVFNFTPATTWLQLVAWVAYLVPTGLIFIRATWGTPARAPRPASVPAGIPA